MAATRQERQHSLAKTPFGSMSTMRALNKFKKHKRGSIKRFGRPKPRFGRSKTRWMAAMRKVNTAHSLGAGPSGQVLADGMSTNSSTGAAVPPAPKLVSESNFAVSRKRGPQPQLGSLVAQPGSDHIKPLLKIAAQRIARRRRLGSKIEFVSLGAAEIAARKANPAAAAFIDGTSAAARLGKGHPTREKEVSGHTCPIAVRGYRFVQMFTSLASISLLRILLCSLAQRSGGEQRFSRNTHRM